MLNGPPGVGKSTCAHRWAESAGAVAIEIDSIRMSIDGWQRNEETRLEARQIAIELIDGHLRRGADVIVPQYLGRAAFIDELQRTAEQAGAAFVELWLSADEDEAVARFGARRSDGLVHPEAEVQDVRAAVADAIDRLERLALDRPRAVRVDASGEPDVTLALISDLLET